MNSLPFSQVIAKNIDELDNRIFDMNKAALLIIDGGVGEGKTTEAVHVADYVNKRHGLDEINIKEQKQIAMGGVDFTKKLRQCFKEKLPVLIYDEAGDFNKRGALTRFNAMLNRTFETYRAFKILVILCLPTCAVLDQDLFDKNIPRMTLHCYNRTKKQGNIKGYSLYRTLYVRERMKKLTIKSFAYDVVEPNFYAHFKDLPAERRRELDVISTKGKIKELEKAEIKLEGLISYTEMSQRLARSVRWIKAACSELRIKHVKIIENRKYFDQGVVDLLADYIDGIQSRDDHRKNVAKGTTKGRGVKK